MHHEHHCVKPGNVLISMMAYRPVMFSMMTSMPNRSRPNVCWSLTVRLRSISVSGLNSGCSNSLSSIFTDTTAMSRQTLMQHFALSFYLCIIILSMYYHSIYVYYSWKRTPNFGFVLEFGFFDDKGLVLFGFWVIIKNRFVFSLSSVKCGVLVLHRWNWKMLPWWSSVTD